MLSWNSDTRKDEAAIGSQHVAEFPSETFKISLTEIVGISCIRPQQSFFCRCTGLMKQRQGTAFSTSSISCVCVWVCVCTCVFMHAWAYVLMLSSLLSGVGGGAPFGSGDWRLCVLAGVPPPLLIYVSSCRLGSASPTSWISNWVEGHVLCSGEAGGGGSTKGQIVVHSSRVELKVRNSQGGKFFTWTVLSPSSIKTWTDVSCVLHFFLPALAGLMCPCAAVSWRWQDHPELLQPGCLPSGRHLGQLRASSSHPKLQGWRCW